VADSTVRTETVLDQLVAGKREELARRQAAEPLSSLRERALAQQTPQSLAAALQGDRVRLIAEIKKASPSAGILEAEFDPVHRARTYVENGAAALSILTEERRFLGNLEHVVAVRASLSSQPGSPRPPILRKDFLFDPYQLYEARAYGADAVLLIVAVLEQGPLIDLLALARELGLSALVEVHDEAQTERALAAGADIVGINNRDLRTFVTALDVTERLSPLVQNRAVIVSESGIQGPSDVMRLARSGVDAILVGEALMRSASIAASVRALCSVARAAPEGDRSVSELSRRTGERRGTN
jgi:indole-3-glycerol phosphate synthase